MAIVDPAQIALVEIEDPEVEPQNSSSSSDPGSEARNAAGRLAEIRARLDEQAAELLAAQVPSSDIPSFDPEDTPSSNISVVIFRESDNEGVDFDEEEPPRGENDAEEVVHPPAADHAVMQVMVAQLQHVRLTELAEYILSEWPDENEGISEIEIDAIEETCSIATARRNGDWYFV